MCMHYLLVTFHVISEGGDTVFLFQPSSNLTELSLDSVGSIFSVVQEPIFEFRDRLLVSEIQFGFLNFAKLDVLVD